jgi:DNA-damage-inducible protein D
MEDDGTQALIPSANNAPLVRTVWFHGRLYFSLIDVVDYLKVSKKPARSYWAQIKAQVQTEGFQEALTKIIKLPLRANDGWMRETDCADRETVLRIIQSIPSPKAEPFKRFLAKVGNDKLDELSIPAADADFLGKQRVYLDKGYDEEWSRLRVQCDLIRNALTDTWQDRGVATSLQFSVLTDTMHAEAFGLHIKAHKAYKNLAIRDNLRDHMTPAELGLQAFTEGLANTLHQSRNSQGYEQILIDVTDAGQGGKKAREAAEEILGDTLVSSKNYKYLLKGEKKVKKLPISSQSPEQMSLFDDQKTLEKE